MFSIARLSLLAACIIVGSSTAAAVALHSPPRDQWPSGDQWLPALRNLPAAPAKEVAAADKEVGPADSKMAPPLVDNSAMAYPEPCLPPKRTRTLQPAPSPAPLALPTQLYPPQPVDYEPRVANQIDRLDEKLDNLREVMQRRQDQLNETLNNIQHRELLQRLVPSAPPAATPAPPPTATAQPTPQLLPEPLEEGDELPELAPPSNPQIRQGADAGLEITLNQSNLREVLEALSAQSQLNILASPNVTGTVTATLSGVSPERALDAILRSTGYVARTDGQFVYVGTAQEIETMMQADDRVQTRVYRPNYVTAAELQTLVTPLLTPSVGTASVGSADLGAGRVSVSSPAKFDIPASNVSSGGIDFAGGDVLLVRDYGAVLEQIDSIVHEVDERPRQVSIEATILSVKLNDSNELGVNFEVLRDKQNVRLISGDPINSLAELDFVNGGLKLGFLDSSLSAFVTALETIGDTDVVASPRVLCLNKQRAEILIGSQLGYVSTTVTENAATQSIEFLEVGTQLRLRPFISHDRMVRLEIHPELSTGSVRVENGFTLPDKEVTQVTSNIMCGDGRTVVIGGLIREDLGTTSSQIPLLGSLPGVGPVFRQKKETINRREIIVLITPRIIGIDAGDLEADVAEQAFSRRQQLYADKMSPLGTRHLGRQHLRRARAAWAAGDADRAFREINLALHFDRQNADIVVLREEILTAIPPERATIRRHLSDGLAPWERPHRDYSRFGYPWQAPPPVADDTIDPSDDRGTSGPQRTLDEPARSPLVPLSARLPQP